MKKTLKQKISDFISLNPELVVCAFDLETLIDDSLTFLTGERIIAISASFFSQSIKSFTFVAESDTAREEMRILRELDEKFAEFAPDIIIGYNHTGYDIPLIMTKIKNLKYEDRTRNLEYYFGTSWCMDMMYLLAEDLYVYDGFHKIRKLDEVLVHEKYRTLKTMKTKSNVQIEGMNKAEAIKHLWLNDRKKFTEYSLGDSYDVLVLFKEIIGMNRN